MRSRWSYPLLLSFLLHSLVFALLAWPDRVPETSWPDTNEASTSLRITISDSPPAPPGSPVDVANTFPGPGRARSVNTEDTGAVTTPTPLPPPLEEPAPEEAARPDGRRAPEPAVDIPVLPSSLSIHEAVATVMSERSRARAEWLQDCSPRQRRNPLFDCEEDVAIDYGRLTQNSVYTYFTPPAAPDNKRPALDVLSSDATVIRERLEGTAHETLQVDGFIQQLQESAGARTRTTQAQRMQDLMLLNDSTIQLRNRVMGQAPVRLQE